MSYGGSLNIKDIVSFLQGYDGPEMNIMEVCGSHTGAIAKNGIQSLLSDRLHLISGPGCPVCVTPSAYVDRLISFAEEGRAVVTFGDLIRVPGSTTSLQKIRGEGRRVEMVYSPLDVLRMAESEPDTEFVFAAVGFETTTPVYALMMRSLYEKDIRNVKLLTALKTMPAVIDAVAGEGDYIDGFLAPGHVSVVTGSCVFEPIAAKRCIPFGVAGFTGEEILTALYGIVRSRGVGRVMNFYPSVVTREGNVKAKKEIDIFFEPCDAVWRGIGRVPGSGMRLRSEHRERFDAGSDGLDEDVKKNKACRCAETLVGKIRPSECPLFGRVCNPENPQGACMVSEEGSCFTAYNSGEF